MAADEQGARAVAEEKFPGRVQQLVQVRLPAPSEALHTCCMRSSMRLRLLEMLFFGGMVCHTKSRERCLHRLHSCLRRAGHADCEGPCMDSTRVRVCVLVHVEAVLRMHDQAVLHAWSAMGSDPDHMLPYMHHPP